MTFTRDHTATLAFIINLLGTLEDRQCDQYVRDLLYVHQRLLTDVYVHIVQHQTTDRESPAGSGDSPCQN